MQIPADCFPDNRLHVKAQFLMLPEFIASFGDPDYAIFRIFFIQFASNDSKIAAR
jgi:hypothetical protein